MKSLFGYIKNTFRKHQYALLFICLFTFLFWLLSSGIKYYENNVINQSKAEIISRIDDLFQKRDTIILLIPPKSNRVIISEEEDKHKLDSIKKTIGSFYKQLIFSESEDSSFYYHVFVRHDIDYFESYDLRPESYFIRKHTSYQEYYDIVNSSTRNAFEKKYKMESVGDSVIKRLLNIKGKYHLLHKDLFGNPIIRKSQISVSDSYTNDIIEYSLKPYACYTIGRDEEKVFKYFGIANLVILILSFIISYCINHYFFLRHKRKDTKKQKRLK